MSRDARELDWADVLTRTFFEKAYNLAPGSFDRAFKRGILKPSQLHPGYYYLDAGYTVDDLLAVDSEVRLRGRTIRVLRVLP